MSVPFADNRTGAFMGSVMESPLCPAFSPKITGPFTTSSASFTSCRALFERTGNTPVRLSLNRAGEERRQKGKIIIEGHAAPRPIPPGQGVTQAAVQGAVALFFFRRQFIRGGPHISKHRSTAFSGS